MIFAPPELIPSSVPLFRTLQSHITQHAFEHTIRQSMLEERPDCGAPIVLTLAFITDILVQIFQLPDGDFVASTFSIHSQPDQTISPDISDGFLTCIRWHNAYTYKLLAEYSGNTPSKLL